MIYLIKALPLLIIPFLAACNGEIQKPLWEVEADNCEANGGLVMFIEDESGIEVDCFEVKALCKPDNGTGQQCPTYDYVAVYFSGGV